MCSYSYIKKRLHHDVATFCKKNPGAEQELLITKMVIDRNRTT